MSELATFLDVILGEGEGYAALAFGPADHWTERRYRWPAERAQLEDDVRREDATGADVYLCPALRFSDRRRKGDAVPPRVVWVDLDQEAADEALVEKLDGPVVLSGTPGRRHLYALLSRPVDLGTHARLNRALADRLGGDAKWSDESLLRLPGTHNHKSDPPRSVVLEKAGGRVWDPDDLAELLEVADPASARTTPAALEDVPEREPAPDPLPERVRALLERDARTRPTNTSDALAAVVWACRDEGLNVGQAVAVAEGHPGAEKFTRRPGGLAAQVATIWSKAGNGPTVLRRTAAEVASGVLPTLPEEFWTARPSLAHIRRAAHARCASADLVLHVVLARLASLQHHDVRIETGIGNAAVVNVFTAPVGPSGAGKSSGVRVARELLETPEFVAMADGYRDGVPLGSGEGLAELFMGTVEEPTGEEIARGPHKGETRTRTVRRQTRHNALVVADEGESLTRMLERSGATIGPALRSAWVGETLGQANASTDTTRVIERGNYALGLVLCFQTDTIGSLFADEAGGTPQRFLFASATDPAIPDEAVDWPGPLEVAALAPEGRRTIEVADHDVRASLRAERLALQRGQASAHDPLDAHRPLHLAKVSALLAILDGRREVTGEDWHLAERVWATSTEVRSALLARGRELERERSEARTADYVAREERAAVARDQSAGKVARIAVRLVGWVGDGDHAKAALRRRIAARDRGLYDAAVDHALERGWLRATTAGLELGEETP